MSDDPLDTPIQFVRNVGERRAELLEKLGIFTVRDMLWNLPRDVLDLTEVTPVAELQEGVLQTVFGRVIDVESRTLSRGRLLSAVLLDCSGEYVRGTWFNQRWVNNAFSLDSQFLFSGKPKFKSGRWEFTHPQHRRIEEEVDSADVRGVVLPLYSLTEGLRMPEMRRMARETVAEYANEIPDVLPRSFINEHDQLPVSQAIRQIHLPGSMSEYEAGRRRVIFDDLLEFQVGIALRRKNWQSENKAPALPTTAKIDARIRRLFPFEFTAGQNRAIREISHDLAQTQSMHRLLQADVGAGKTAVALYAMLVAVAAGQQAVLMAPTEVLAQQHWATVNQALVNSRVDRIFLSGKLTAAERRQALDKIKNGDVQIIVGTQAIIQKSVKFANLAVAVIDEQHKFGVAQRAHFSRGKNTPHVLVMTATPIPRSLCLTQFGDLDLSVITELPPGRQPVVTGRVRGTTARKRAWVFIRKQLKEGRQAFIVCPRIEGENADEDSGQLELFPAEAAGEMPIAPEATPKESESKGDKDALPLSAEEVFQTLFTGELKNFEIGLVHGQLDRDRKEQVMDKFRDGELPVLVSTTVIEVGVDVPNATMMVIVHAEQFGLSQLHQLRGRIGRGRFQGYCFLFSDWGTDDAEQRLAAMEETSDGFKIAEVDFSLRGPGEVLGTRQHGRAGLRVANIYRDREELQKTRDIAFKLVETGAIDSREFAPLKNEVLTRFGNIVNLSQSG